MEAREQYFRHPADDCRLALRHGRRIALRRAGRHPRGNLSGALLPGSPAQNHRTDDWADGGRAVDCLRLFWADDARAAHPRNVRRPRARAVPNSYYEGSLALGATDERSVFRATVPAAKSGILASVVLAIGRAIGEAMAVKMVIGNQPRLTSDLLSGIRTLTSGIVIEMGYAEGLHREALIAAGIVLFVFILLINASFSVLKRREQQ